MTYVITDLHGEYEKFKELLACIRFSDEDTLYVGGDTCDRGAQSAGLYLDMMDRKNVLAILGNHEMMALRHLERVLRQHHEEGVCLLDIFSQEELHNWLENGGDATLISLFDQPKEDQYRILSYIQSLPLYRTVEVGDTRYVLVHGGLGDEGEKVENPEDVDPYDLVWSRPDFDSTYFANEPNTRLLVGHTPTFLMQRFREPARIYYGKGNVIALDCGAAYPKCLGRLSCLCLETGEEWYV